MGAKTKLQLRILDFSNVFFHVFMYFEILKTVVNWTLKSNVALFEKVNIKMYMFQQKYATLFVKKYAILTEL